MNSPSSTYLHGAETFNSLLLPAPHHSYLSVVNNYNNKVISLAVNLSLTSQFLLTSVSQTHAVIE